MWIRGGGGGILGLSLHRYCFVPLRVLRDLRGLTLWFLRRNFVADSSDRFLGFFPATKSTKAKISFTGGAKA
jgi:hypothetical protein